MLTVLDIGRIIESWAPREIAWERDNIGLQVGNPGARVRAILVCLEVHKAVVQEARHKRANLIVSHHPLIFRPLNAVATNGTTGRITENLLKAGINLYSAHTNLDFTRGGTSFALGQALKLQEIEFLVSPYEVERKVVTFVPAEHVDRVAGAMAAAGAGVIGKYEHCSFRINGTGTFRGNEFTHPTVGTKGNLERVPEVRLEMGARSWQVNAIVAAMKKSHPYEEVAYDVYPLENKSNDYGMGIIGSLVRPMQLKSFLATIKRKLNVPALRYTGEPGQTVRRVAACGGGGSDLIDEAIKRGADVFITADIKYHSFHDAEGRIALVDAGHYETENPVVPAVSARLRQEIRKIGQNIPVYRTRTSTNPLRYE